MKKSYESAIQQELDLKQHLKDLVSGLPEMMPGVKPMGKYGCVVSFSTLQEHNSFSPEYFLPLASKQTLLEIIDRSTLTTIVTRFGALIKTGHLQLTAKQRIRVHPEFIAALKKMWEEHESTEG